MKKIKYAIKFFILMVPIIIATLFIGSSSLYQVTLNGIDVGYVQNKSEVKKICNEIKKEIQEQFQDFEIGEDDLVFRKINEGPGKITEKKELKQNIKSSQNIKVSSYKVTLNSNVIGYVSNKNNVESALNDIAEDYLKDLSIDKENVENIHIKTNIKYEDEKVSLSNIVDKDDIKKNINILNGLNQNKLLQIEIQALKKECVQIESPKKVVNTDEISVGESKEEQGKPGKKDITKKETYINGKLKDSSIVEESILSEPTETVVYKGNKNPIVAGVPFLIHPTSGGVLTSPYGERWGKTHKGIDIGVPLGTPIKAAYDGVVEYAEFNPGGYGNMIIIKHDGGIETLYAHASKILTEKGKSVKKGDVIANVGSTGRSTGPHLHFEVKYNGENFDPIKFIKK